LQGAGAAAVAEPGEGSLAQTGRWAGAGLERRRGGRLGNESGKKRGEVGVVTDEKKVLVDGALAEEVLELREGGLRREGG